MTCSSCGKEVSHLNIIGDGTNRGLCCVPDYYQGDEEEWWKMKNYWERCLRNLELTLKEMKRNEMQRTNETPTCNGRGNELQKVWKRYGTLFPYMDVDATWMKSFDVNVSNGVDWWTPNTALAVRDVEELFDKWFNCRMWWGMGLNCPVPLFFLFFWGLVLTKERLQPYGSIFRYLP